jgi:hypothetical protein
MSVLSNGCSVILNEYGEIVDIKIPPNVSNINSSFPFTAITNLVIPDNVSFICNDAFINCLALRNLVLGKNLLFIGNNSFKGSSLDDVKLPDKFSSCWRRCFC